VSTITYIAITKKNENTGTTNIFKHHSQSTNVYNNIVDIRVVIRGGLRMILFFAKNAGELKTTISIVPTYVCIYNRLSVLFFILC